MNIHDAYPSKWLKAGDLKGKEVTVTIDSVAAEEVGAKKETKLVIYFMGKNKGMVLNKTNAGMIASVYGPETDNWNNKRVVLKTEMVSFQGKLQPGLRVYPAGAASAPAEPPPPSDDDFVADDEDAPF